ncbi:MAG TPA: hypothetical protein VHI75_10680 [Casimicrobiaceae bacterium]|nr:hypothetical protein [Casimicrobiaceae bacterium]
MNPALFRGPLAQIVVLGFVVSWMVPVAAQNRVEGKLDVDGKPVAITQVYAYAKEGFFDKKKQDVVVMLCDAPVPAPVVRDTFAYKDLIATGKVHCVRQTIDADKQVINYDVGHQRFRQPRRERRLDRTRLRTANLRRQDDRRPDTHQITAEIVQGSALQLRHHLQRGDRAEEIDRRLNAASVPAALIDASGPQTQGR